MAYIGNFFGAGTATSTTGCQATPYPPSGYLWNFGDPGSGTENTSTLSSPSHLYPAPGSYSVSLILQNPCSNDTIIQTINVSTPGPTPAVTGNTVFCKGDRYTFTVSGGNTYSWSTGATAATVALSPTQTSVYSVSATLNGCTLSKTFSVVVNPCLGVSVTGQNKIRLFPNPAGERIHIESDEPAELSIYDLNSRLTLKQTVQKGISDIDIQNLPPGVYIAEINGWRAKFVKQE